MTTRRLNDAALKRLRDMAEAMHCMGSKQDRIDAAALTMLLDWHDSETRAPASDGETRIVDAIRERRS